MDLWTGTRILILLCVACLSARASALGPTDETNEAPPDADALIAHADALRDAAAGEQAALAYAQALEALEVLGEKSTARLSRILFDLGKIETALNRYDDAVNHFEWSLSVATGLDEPDPAIADTIRAELAAVHHYRGDTEIATGMFEEVAEFRERHYGPDSVFFANSLVNLAYMNESLGRFDEGLDLAKRANSIFEEFGTEKDAADAADAMLKLASLLSRVDQFGQAEVYFNKALEMQRRVLGDEHLDVGDTLNNMAVMFFSLSRYDESQQHFEAALEVYRANNDMLQVATATGNLGVLSSRRGHYDHAAEYLEEALRLRREYLGSDHPRVAHTMGELATNLLELGRFEESIELQQDALAIREKSLGPDHPITGSSLYNLAQGYRMLGNHARAAEAAERALAIWEVAYGPEHHYVARALMQVAMINREIGNYGRAQETFRRAIATSEATIGPDHPYTADIVLSLAVLYLNLGDQDNAEPLLRRALDSFEKSYGLEHKTVAESLRYLGELLAQRGDYEAADPLLRKSAAVYRNAVGPDHLELSTAVTRLARNEVKRGKPDSALGHFDEALAILSRAVDGDHPAKALIFRERAVAEEVSGNIDKAENLIHSALAILAPHQDLKPTLASLLSQASSFYSGRGNSGLAIFFGKRAVNVAQDIRAANVSIDPGLETQFEARISTFYRNLADLLIREGRLAEAEQVLDMLKEEEYFEFVRRRKGGPERLATRSVYSTDEAPWHDRYEEINGRLVEISETVADLKEKRRTEGVDLTETERAQLQELEADLVVSRQAFEAFLDALHEHFAAASGERATEFGERDLRSLGAMQGTLRHLGEDVALVSYLVTDDTLWAIFTTSNVRVRRQSDVDATTLNEKIFAFRQVVQDPGQNPLPLAQELYRLVIEPLADDLAQASTATLMLSLDDTLRYLPFGALHDGNQYVAERLSLAVFTPAAKSTIGLDSLEWREAAGLGVSDAVEGFAPLPAVRQELDGIVREELLGDETGVLSGVIRLNSAFTTKTLEDTLNQGFPVVHVASHFVFRPGNEFESYLLLGDGSRVSLAELKVGNFPLTEVDLLTLSACDTASGGRRADGREVEGFGALAQNQGARSVLATLWPVADSSTALFMEAFYRFREQGELSKAEALRQAQLSFIDGSDYMNIMASRGLRINADSVDGSDTEKEPAHSTSHPYFWAPFILMGNWQ